MGIDVSAWSSLVLEAPIVGGHRNEVWCGWWQGERVALRRSRRDPESLRWELELLLGLEQAGFVVPAVVPTDSGQRCDRSVIVQRWIEGREPSSPQDWHRVAAELRRVHSTFEGHPQRPGCHVVHELGRTSRSVDADISALPADVADVLLELFARASGRPVSVIHGDPGPSNLRITDAGRVGFLDWDESRVDVLDLDLANLGAQVLDDELHDASTALADAWETANAWQAEPEYARERWEALRRRRST